MACFDNLQESSKPVEKRMPIETVAPNAVKTGSAGFFKVLEIVSQPLAAFFAIAETNKPHALSIEGKLLHQKLREVEDLSLDSHPGQQN
jgi:hypothetical protein